jgi:4-hydroxy-tetrahydrodipicolinate synthase
LPALSYYFYPFTCRDNTIWHFIVPVFFTAKFAAALGSLTSKSCGHIFFINLGVKMLGTTVALVTPFRDDYSINEDEWVRQLERHRSAGTNCLLPCGTTGETPTLTDREKERIIRLTVEQRGSGQSVMAGSGSNNTDATVAATKKLADFGVDYALVITPYYNKPNQEGLYRHFMTVLEASPLPVVLYNVPGRTGVNLLPQTLLRLAAHEKLVAIKEASGDLMQIAEMVRLCGDQLHLLSGDDGLNLPILSVGGRGVVSVAANVVPERLRQLTDAAAADDWAIARRLHLDLLPLTRALFIESSPIPTKVALHLLGYNPGPVRLPLGPPSETTEAEIHATLRAMKLI